MGCSGNCAQGRYPCENPKVCSTPLNVELLLQKGSITGPFKRTKPFTVSILSRVLRAFKQLRRGY